MYSYLRGVYKGPLDEGVVLLEVGGVGYELIVPPIVEEELRANVGPEDPLTLYVSALAGRDQPWPALFGFLRPEEKAFWELLKTVPRMGGKGAAKAMAVPIDRIAQAIQDGNKPFLDALPGITLEGAEKMIASLRKKVGPFLRLQLAARRDGAGARGDPSPVDGMREEAVLVLVNTGVKRLDAERAVDDLLSERDDLVSTQDLVMAYFKALRRGA